MMSKEQASREFRQSGGARESSSTIPADGLLLDEKRANLVDRRAFEVPILADQGASGTSSQPAGGSCSL